MLTFFLHSLIASLDILDHHKKGLTVWLWSSFIPSHRLRSIQRTGAETSKRLTEESRELKMLEQYGNIAFTFHKLATSNCKQNVHICTPSCLAWFGWSYLFKFLVVFCLAVLAVSFSCLQCSAERSSTVSPRHFMPWGKKRTSQPQEVPWHRL